MIALCFAAKGEQLYLHSRMEHFQTDRLPHAARQMAGGCTAILLTEMKRNGVGTLYKRHTQLESVLRQRGHQAHV